MLVTYSKKVLNYSNKQGNGIQATIYAKEFASNDGFFVTNYGAVDNEAKFKFNFQQ